MESIGASVISLLDYRSSASMSHDTQSINGTVITTIFRLLINESYNQFISYADFN